MEIKAVFHAWINLLWPLSSLVTCLPVFPQTNRRSPSQLELSDHGWTRLRPISKATEVEQLELGVRRKTQMVSCVEGKETSRVSCVKPLKSTGSNQVSNCVCINDGLYFFLPKSLHIRLPRRTALQSSSSSSSSLWVFSRDVWFSPQVVPHSATGIFCTFFFLTGIHFTPTPLTPLPSPTDKLD